MTNEQTAILPNHPTRYGAALASLTQATVLVGGLPLLLVRGVGWPLPHAMPQWEDVQRAYQLRYLPDRFVLGALACAGWICWIMIVGSLIHAAIANVRAANYQRPRLVLPAVHGVVGRWISAATLVVALTSRSAGASPVPVRTVVAQGTAPIDTKPSTPNHPDQQTPPPAVAPLPLKTSAGRTVVTGEHQTYWDIAEATLGDGQRWREILNANPQLGNIDLVPAGITIHVPASDSDAAVIHNVRKGDNLWKVAAKELAEAHDGRRPTNSEVVPYWKEVIETNEPDLRSGDPDLIYPGEVLHLPPIDNDARSLPASPVPATRSSDEPPQNAPDVPTSTIEVTTTIGPVAEAQTPAVEPVPDELLVDDDVDTNFEVPWLEGLAITGIASAGILAAWHGQRRRRIRAHKLGDPIPVMSEPDKELVSQLRAIAAERHHAAVDTAFRYLATTVGPEGVMPSISVARAGRHSVELLLDDPQQPTPPGFIRLDQQTIVVNPGKPDDEIAAAISDRNPPAPLLVALGADDVGTVLVDLERTRALAIEAATTDEAIAVATALLTELTTQPWASGVRVLSMGMPATVDPDGRVTSFEDTESLIRQVEAHIQSQSDESLKHGTHTVRVRTNNQVDPMVIMLGPGAEDTARVLAAAASQSGSALAVVCCDAIANSAWRLVTTNGRTTLEPTGLTVSARHVRPASIDGEANDRLVEAFGTPSPKFEDPDFDGGSVVDETSPEAVEGTETEETLVGEPPAEEADVDEDQTHVISDKAAKLKSHRSIGGFDQLSLLDDLATELSLDERVAEIMRRRPVELVLLDGPPRLEGVTWNGKDAARADEIVAFLALNGPSTLSQVANAIWPDKVRPGDPAKQMISRARKMLGMSEDGQLRLSAGTRSAPYRLHDVGCDWHRFEQLCLLAESASGDEKVQLLRTALAVVRTGPFEGTRPGAFHWAADQCFDSRLRYKINAATHVLTDLIDSDRAIVFESRPI